MLKFNEITDAKTYSANRAELLVLLEGYELSPYVDSVGDPTIGIGFNLVYNLEPVLRVIVGNRNWSDQLLARLEAEVDKAYAPYADSSIRANLDRVMQTWHDTKNDKVPETFRFKNDAQMTRALDALAPTYDAHIDRWLAGIPDSREREALFSLAWNGPSLLGPKLKAAIESGDRAEAWYEIRYNSNGNAIAGLANRRYVEAETFGLFRTEGKATFAEALQAGQMFARHRDTILDYENRYDPDAAGSTKGMPGIDALSGEMTPAVTAALKKLGLSQSTPVEELLAASDTTRSVNGDGSRFDNARNNDDLILGSKGADTLIGGNGKDIIAGLRGADTLTGGKGADLFVFTTAKDSLPSAPDVITDFGTGADRLVFSKIGSLELLAERGAAFTGAGDEIRWYQSKGNTIVEVDLDGDRNADMTIILEGRLTLDAGDLLL